MLKIEGIQNQILKTCLNTIETKKDVLILGIKESVNAKQTAKRISDYFVTFPEGQVIIISKIKFVKDKGRIKNKKNINIAESVCRAFKKRDKKVNTLRIGEILEDKNNFLNKTINDIKRGKRVYFNNGETYFYYISKKDVKNAVEKVIDKDVKGKLFNITLNKVSESDIINWLASFYNFNSEPLHSTKEEINEKMFGTENNKLINFKPSVPLKEQIKKTKGTPAIKEKQVQNNIKTKKSINFAPYLYKLGKAFVLSLMLILLLTAVDFSLDNYYLYKNLKGENWDEVNFYANKLRQRTLPTKYGENYNKIYNTLYYTSSTINLLKDSSENRISSSSVGSVKGISTKALSYANSIEEQYLITEKEKGFYKENIATINDFAYGIKYLELLEIYPLIKEDQNILFLIQNSNELRPTGGFIGSYAYVETKELSIKNYKFDDIYNIDGVLETEHSEVLVETPQEYTDFIETPYLFSRDINLILESNKRNKIIKTYFEKALEKEIDLIVYLNLDSMKRVLTLTGPIQLGVYEETVTAENFDTLAQTYSEKNYYEGSSQKKNFLSLLGTKVVEKIALNEELANKRNLSLLLKMLENKEILVYSDNKDIQKVLNNLNLSGKIEDFSKEEDYLYILENNLGENKVNKKVEKQVDHKVFYDQRRGLKTTDIAINIENHADTYNWPYGDYKGMLHIAIPKEATITQASIDKTNKEEVDLMRNLVVKSINNLTLVEIPFSIETQEAARVTISYENRDVNFLDNPYKINFIKQPGAKPYSISTSLLIPDIKDEKKEIILEKDIKVSF